MKSIYCVKCRSKTDTDNLHGIRAKNGKPALHGTCAICGTKKYQFISEKEVKEGGFIGKLFRGLFGF